MKNYLFIASAALFLMAGLSSCTKTSEAPSDKNFFDINGQDYSSDFDKAELKKMWVEGTQIIQDLGSNYNTQQLRKISIY